MVVGLALEDRAVLGVHLHVEHLILGGDHLHFVIEPLFLELQLGLVGLAARMVLFGQCNGFRQRQTFSGSWETLQCSMV